MVFSKQKLRTLKPQKSRAGATFLLAFAVAAAIFVPYIVIDRGYFFFYGDFNVQQIPFYMRVHDLVRSGNFGWDFGTDLGANLIGSYSFYLLGSPFFWLTVPFPSSLVPHLMAPLLMLKFALAAWAAYMYLSRFLKSNETAMLGGLLYAFSGFSVYNIFFNHFHEAIIVFPLLLLSLELLITENRRGVFAFMVALSATVNYFFFFGMVVFTVIYWFVRMCCECYKFSLSRFFALVFEALLGVALSAVLIYPTVLALAGNNRLGEMLTGWNAIMYGKEQIYANIIQCFFFPPDLPARPVFFPGAEVRWSSLGGWLPLFSMVGVWGFAGQHKRSWLSKLIGILIFMALVPILNSAFYMFNYAYYARWFYMPILLMCLATCIFVEDSGGEWKRAFWWVGGITLAVTAVIGFFPELDGEGKFKRLGLYTEGQDNTYVIRFFLTCAIAIVSLAVLRVLLSQRDKNKQFFTRAAIACVCAVSVIYASLFVGLGKTHSYNVERVMINSLMENEVSLPDGEWRIDVYEGVDNTGMYLGYDSINAFHSIVPVSVTDFWTALGEGRGVASRPSAKTYAARSLLSVKYLFDLKDTNCFKNEKTGVMQMQGYEYVNAQSGYDIYENTNFIPYGFTYDYYMTSETAFAYGKETAANMMVKAILLNDSQIEKYGKMLKNIADDYAVGEETQDGQTPLVTDYDSFVSDCADRRASSAQSFKKGKSEFTASITLPRDNLVFFSIPYEEGWTAFVNGKETEIEQVNIGFMAVAAQAGENEIHFVYKTPGLPLGIMITLCAAALWLVYTVFAGIIIRHREENECYPEGEMLLKAWREADTAEALAKFSEDDTIDISDFSE